jgi:26S proteasome non-ATPase regulatory subunit 9
MDRANYEKLVERKLEVEKEIGDWNQVLVAEGNIGMNGKLVDSEGYPRSDIDLYKVREARQQIIRLGNDYKILMAKIEQEIVHLHEQTRASEATEMDQFVEKPVMSHGEDPASRHRPFAKISQVDRDSPSFEAGLQLNDEIVQFGPLTFSNTNKNLAEIAIHVKSNINKIILLNVLRQDTTGEAMDVDENAEVAAKKSVKIKLVPKTWSGHGVLGCKIIPID